MLCDDLEERDGGGLGGRFKREGTRVCLGLIHVDVWQKPTQCAKLLQSCLTLCHPMDCRPPGSSVHGILQARIPEHSEHLEFLDGLFWVGSDSPDIFTLVPLLAEDP